MTEKLSKLKKLANFYIGDNKKMKRILISLFVLFTLAAGLPATAQTYEQVKKAQVERALNGPNGAQIKKSVNKYSTMYKVDPYLVHALILTESGYVPTAKSVCGAAGLMQLMPPTFRARNVGSNMYDIDQNIHAGVKHFAGLMARYNNNLFLALSAYNIGGGATDKYKGKPHPATRGYINTVMYHKKILESVQL